MATTLTKERRGEIMEVLFVEFALEKGFNVLIEKPMTTNYKDALELSRIAKEHRNIVMVGHIYLYNPAFLRAKKLIKSIGKIKPTAIIIVVANPVDIITCLVQKISGLDSSHVFGTGTSLDTARLRTEVGKALGVSAQNVDGYVLGEHGDTEFDAFSTVSVGGISIKDLKLTKAKLSEIEDKVKNAAYEIINRKGATFYGIAMTVANIVEAILFDQHRIMPLSVHLDSWNGISGVCLSAPAVLGRQGVEKVWPVKLNFLEKRRLQKSAKAIKKFL